MANRKCAHCNAETPSPCPPRQGAGTGHLHIRDPRPSHPHAPPPEVEAGRVRALLRGAQRGPSRPDGDFQARHVSLHLEPQQRRCKDSRRLGAQVSPPRSEPWSSSGLPQAYPASRTLSPRLLPRDTPPGRSLPQEKLLTPHGATLPLVRHPREPTHGPRRALGTPPHPRAGANPSRDKNVRARHGTAASAPHAQRPQPPRPGTAPFDPGLTVSSATAAGMQEAGRGGGEIQYGRAPQLLPAATSSRLREDAVTSKQRQLRWRPRQHHISPTPHPLASSPSSPAPLPWQRGAEISPAPPSRPASRDPWRGSARPSHLLPKQPPARLCAGCPEQRVGNGEWGGWGVKCGVRKGGAPTEGSRAETPWASAGFGPGRGRGRRENGKASPVWKRTYRSEAEARRGC